MTHGGLLFYFYLWAWFTGPLLRWSGWGGLQQRGAGARLTAQRCTHLVFYSQRWLRMQLHQRVRMREKSMMQAYVSHKSWLQALFPALGTTDELWDKQGFKRIWRTSRTNVSFQRIIDLAKRSELDLLCDLQDGESFVPGLHLLDVVGLVWGSLVTLQINRGWIHELYSVPLSISSVVPTLVQRPRSYFGWRWTWTWLYCLMNVPVNVPRSLTSSSLN